jgi:uncharacterized membrane-anchored protein
MVYYAPLQQGLSFLLEPANFASFALTVFGLFVIATAGLLSTLPAIRKQAVKPNLKRIGAVGTALGGYFVFNILYYYLTGGYAAHPSVWYEIIGPLHNPDLWCLVLLFFGIPTIVYGKLRQLNRTPDERSASNKDAATFH